jgi:hypothetical protein
MLLVGVEADDALLFGPSDAGAGDLASPADRRRLLPLLKAKHPIRSITNSRGCQEQLSMEIRSNPRTGSEETELDWIKAQREADWI